MQCNIRSRKKFISEEHKAMRTELISIETDTLPLDGAFHRLDEITAQARALVAVGHGQELMLVPGWWYVITAESFLDRMTEMPDVRELAATIKCPTLFIRGDQENPDTDPAEAFQRRSAGSCDVEIVPNCDHFYVRRKAAICDLVSGWLARTLKFYISSFPRKREPRAPKPEARPGSPLSRGRRLGQITPSLRRASTSPALIPSHSPKTSALCCPSNGAGASLGGRPSKRTGQDGILKGPDECSMVCRMPRSVKLGSFVSSIVSSTAPAGTPAAPMVRIASCLSRRRVQSATIALTSAMRSPRAFGIS